MRLCIGSMEVPLGFEVVVAVDVVFLVVVRVVRRVLGKADVVVACGLVVVRR